MNRHLFFASIAGAVIASAPAMANPIPPSWYVVNRSNSVCDVFRFTPRQFDAALRAEGKVPQVTVVRRDDQSVLGVTVEFQDEGRGVFVDLFQDKAECQGYVDFLIKKGELMPKDGM